MSPVVPHRALTQPCWPASIGASTGTTRPTAGAAAAAGVAVVAVVAVAVAVASAATAVAIRAERRMVAVLTSTRASADRIGARSEDLSALPGHRGRAAQELYWCTAMPAKAG